MKKLIVLMSLIVMTSAACSNDGTQLVTYTAGKDTYSIKIGDVKKDLMMYAQYQPQIAGDIAWHKDFILDRYITKDLYYFEELARGFTNSPDFQAQFNSGYQRQYLLALYSKGSDYFNKNINNGLVEVARASHILVKIKDEGFITNTKVIFTNEAGQKRSYTNVTVTPYKLSNQALTDALLQAENKAKNILDTLKSSKNLDKEFSNIATTESEDRGSGYVGGDLSFFARGAMVKEFETAVFGAKNKGLIDAPVKSIFGYHIIYVTFPAQKRAVKDIENMVGKQNFARLQGSLQNQYYTSERERMIKELYAVDPQSKTLTLSNGNAIGKAYNDKDFNTIPDATPLLTIGKTTYSWKDIKDVINIFVPDFVSNTSFDNAATQMNNFKNFIFFVEIAKEIGYEASADFKKEVDKARDTVLKSIAGANVEKEIRAQADKQITPETLKKYYDGMKSAYTKPVTNSKGAVTNMPMTYKEAETRVKEELGNNMVMESYNAWKQKMVTAYKVTYLENGFKVLMNMEKQEIDDQNKKRQEQQKKMLEEQKRQQQQKPTK